jgi:polysaccharide export outer membrane protein
LVKVDSRIIAIMHRYGTFLLGPRFHGRRVLPSNMLRPGDVIAVSVYETGGSALFGPGPVVPGITQTQPGVPGSPSTAAGATTVPPQLIETDGTIAMPYVGRIQAAGRTPGQLGQEIEKQLKGKAVEPQVVITLINASGNAATIGGEVALPKQVVLTGRGERLLDVIAQAGGAKFPPFETYVRIVRDGEVGTVLLQTVISIPSENVVIQPNDQIFLIRNPRTFTVLGASQKVSQYNEDQTVT